MPSGPIHEQNGVSAGLDGKRDLPEVQRHGLGVAGREDETGRLAERGANGAEDIGRGGSLILQGKRARAAFGPASRNLVLLAERASSWNHNSRGLPLVAAISARRAGTFF